MDRVLGSSSGMAKFACLTTLYSLQSVCLEGCTCVGVLATLLQGPAGYGCNSLQRTLLCDGYGIKQQQQQLICSCMPYSLESQGQMGRDVPLMNVH